MRPSARSCALVTVCPCQPGAEQLEDRFYRVQLREWDGWFWRRLRGELISLHSSLPGGCGGVKVSICSQVTDGVRGNGFMLCRRVGC